MCNLYNARTTTAELAHAYDAEVIGNIEWKDEIYPRYHAPVIRDQAGHRILELMAWGFPAQVQGKLKMLSKHVTNARNLASPFWKGSATHPQRRCLVPFTQFAEPKPSKDAEGRPAQHWFTITDQDIPCFAGLWRPTDVGAVFAFCTTEPNPMIKPLHPKAMPVILLAQAHDRWLHGTYDEVLALQSPYPSQMMSAE